MIHVICTFLRFVACLELSNDATFCWTFVDRSLREPNAVKRCKMKYSVAQWFTRSITLNGNESILKLQLI